MKFNKKLIFPAKVLILLFIQHVYEIFQFSKLI